jgi:hypothetical protein
MDDFSPAAVARKVEGLNKLLEARQQLANLVTYMDGKGGAEELIAKVLNDPSLLQSLSAAPKPTATPDQELADPKDKSGALPHGRIATICRHRVRRCHRRRQRIFRCCRVSSSPSPTMPRAPSSTAVQTLAQQALAQTQLIGNDVVKSIEAMIAAIDQQAVGADQPDPAPRRLPEARRCLAWPALPGQQHRDRRAAQDPGDEHLQAGPGQDAQALQGHGLGPEPAVQEALRGRVGQFGGEPFGCLVGDYHFDQSAAGCRTAGRDGQDRRGGARPFIAGASPTVMQMDSWQELANPRDLTKIFTTPEYAAWRSLRDSDDAKYIGLAMPRFLSRLPYGAQDQPGRGVQLRGRHRRRRPHKYTWANAAYAMATNINRSFKLYGWCSRIRGIESGGAVRTCRRTPSPPTTAAST